jgi:hypothetical protein
MQPLPRWKVWWFAVTGTLGVLVVCFGLKLEPRFDAGRRTEWFLPPDPAATKTGLYCILVGGIVLWAGLCPLRR